MRKKLIKFNSKWWLNQMTDSILTFLMRIVYTVNVYFVLEAFSPNHQLRSTHVKLTNCKGPEAFKDDSNAPFTWFNLFDFQILRAFAVFRSKQTNKQQPHRIFGINIKKSDKFAAEEVWHRVKNQNLFKMVNKIWNDSESYFVWIPPAFMPPISRYG